MTLVEFVKKNDLYLILEVGKTRRQIVANKKSRPDWPGRNWSRMDRWSVHLGSTNGTLLLPTPHGNMGISESLSRHNTKREALRELKKTIRGKKIIVHNTRGANARITVPKNLR